MYDFRLHQKLGDRTTSSADTIVDIMRAFLDMESVLDVGCGDGRWLATCRAKGSRHVFGLDGPWTDHSRLLIQADEFGIQDLSRPFDLERRFSLVVSLEVAEHVAGRYAETFVDNLVRHGDVILFGAAVPYQSGFRHINEQWQSYWADLFAAHGFAAYDPLRSQIWNNDDVQFWYKQNTLLYVNRDNAAAVDGIKRYITEKQIAQLPLDVIHPDKYKAVASYQQIAFRPLARELPRQVIRKLSSIMMSRA
jgi:SAM-dependent methyltransferase